MGIVTAEELIDKDRHRLATTESWGDLPRNEKGKHKYYPCFVDRDHRKVVLLGVFPEYCRYKNGDEEEEIISDTQYRMSKIRSFNLSIRIADGEWHGCGGRADRDKWIVEVDDKGNIIEVNIEDGKKAETHDDIKDDKKVRTHDNKGALNKIWFGAPGTGKSHEINVRLKDEEEFGDDCWERATFYPDYSYANFVGCYKPVMIGDKIAYRYVLGPFLRVLAKALANPDGKYVLVVEEINRANPAAVFGDAFQLLDRGNDGCSEYEITPSEEMIDGISSYLMETEELDSDEVDEIVQDLQDNGLKIPSNMYIWATMNSADQGVFPMDTAFKRRWEFEYIGIDDNESGLKGALAGVWNNIRKKINKWLTDNSINEDKCMGPFFIHGKALENGAEFNEAFKSKVLMYLFEDAARQKRAKLFESKTLSQIFNAYDSSEKKVFFNEELNKVLRDALQSVEETKASSTADSAGAAAAVAAAAPKDAEQPEAE